MNFDDLRLRSKNLIPLGIMALTVFAMLAFGASRLVGFSHAASAIIERRDVGALDLSRAGRAVVYIPYSVFGSILFDSDTPAGRATENDFKTSAKTGLDLLKAAAELLPDQAEAIEKLSKRLQALGEMAKAPYQEGVATPGIDHGLDLKPSDLAGAARATKLAAELDAQARGLLADLNAVRESVLSENAVQVRALREQATNAILMLFVLGGFSAVLASAFAYWMTSTKVERPLKVLCDRMRALAQGDMAVEIEGASRRDEIGEMARAVEVFKTNALDRRRVEAEAAQARGTAEAERAAGSQERARTREALTAAMAALRGGLKALADGDLTTRLNEGFAAQFADVRDDFNAAAEKLKTAMGLVVRSTGAIQSSSQEIASASDNLATRTEQQAASIEETAAAMEEITNTLKASARNAQHAAEVVGAADSDAKKGAVVVRQAVEAMDAIAESSNQIGQIIGVIDEIAFQTNLLALNAGVEAARAGDSGRGFAVVAMEVRALAQRSAEAAKEIKALVSTSGAQVHSGVKLVAETGKALDSIIAQVSEINKVVANIAEATQQQATGVNQINSAIAQMDQNTQQNATMVEQSTAASHALSKEMGELTNLVEQFRIGEAAVGEPRGGDLRSGELRASLKAAAPHAFAKPAPPPRARPTPAPAPKLARASGTDWTEF